jgi:hypothetical protein
VNIIVLKDGKSKRTPTIDIILDGPISQLGSPVLTQLGSSYV